MSRWQRVVLLACAAAVNLLLLMSVSVCMVLLIGGEALAEWPDLSDLLDDPFWWGTCGLPAIVVVITQIVFLLPLLGSRPVMAPQGKPLLRTIAMAALIAAALSTGLFFAIAELCGVFASIIEQLFDSDLRDRLPPLISDWFGALWPWIFICTGWVIWTPILVTFARRKPGRSRWSRWVFALLGGTMLETLVVVPIDVMVRRRTECYCSSGSFFALIISMWALLWLTGPGIVIAATSKRRQMWAETHCSTCGHAKGPTPGERCPECGSPWR
jgi:hypothetical protein